MFYVSRGNLKTWKLISGFLYNYIIYSIITPAPSPIPFKPEHHNASTTAAVVLALRCFDYAYFCLQVAAAWQQKYRHSDSTS